MFLKIDPRSSIPIYSQIIDQVKLQAASGRLRLGDRIPTVRELATELRINPNTVAKAYRDLEREGILEGKPGQGSFIACKDSGLNAETKMRMISRAMESPLVQAYHLQLAQDSVRTVFDAKLHEIYQDDTTQEGDRHE
ncbi:GntR family transcriptional regulator [bacterium]|nr:GntR family transcriptional regulator [candidate division CSSED10-310 bacterium]